MLTLEFLFDLLKEIVYVGEVVDFNLSSFS